MSQPMPSSPPPPSDASDASASALPPTAERAPDAQGAPAAAERALDAQGAPAAAERAPDAQGAPAAAERATNAGRGGLAVLGAKVFFIVTGMAQQVILPRAIGLADYGALSRILAASNVVNNVVVAGSIQSASRSVAAAPPEQQPHVLRKLMGMHAGLALLLGGGFAAAAPSIARFQHAEHIVPGLLAMAAVLALYTVYAPLVGALNGRRLFTRQAGLDVLAATLRSAALIGVGWAFVRMGQLGATGSALGAALAVSCVLPVALWWSGLLRRPAGDDAGFDRKAYLKGFAGLAVAQLFTNLLMQIDITLLGRFLSHAAHAELTDAQLATRSADEWVGVYRACQLFAFLPYQLLFSVTQVLFPLLAKARAEGDAAQEQRLVRRGLRLGLILMGLMVSVVVALPHGVLALAFPAEVAERGAGALHVLALGMGLFATMGLCTTVLASLGRERTAAAITAAATLLVAMGAFATVPNAGFGSAQLTQMALATSGGLLVAVVLAAVTVIRETSAFAPFATVARVGMALACSFVLSTFLPHTGKLMTLLLAMAIAAIYLLWMLLSGELSGDERRLILQKLTRR